MSPRFLSHPANLTACAYTEEETAKPTASSISFGICRLRYDPRSQAYRDRKRAQGHSSSDAIRCLKRFIAREICAGTVEEWTLINTSTMDHPFHLHVWPMQVIEQNGQGASSPDWRDVVNLPANGRVTVRVAFAEFRGRSAYHCHILDHEDLGMMGAIEIR